MKAPRKSPVVIGLKPLLADEPDPVADAGFRKGGSGIGRNWRRSRLAKKLSPRPLAIRTVWHATMSWSTCDARAQFLRLAAFAFAFHQLAFCAARALRLLPPGLGKLGQALLTSLLPAFFEEIHQPLQRQLTVGGLRTAVRRRHGSSRGRMEDRHLSADFIDVLAQFPRVGELDFFGMDSGGGGLVARAFGRPLQKSVQGGEH